MFAARKPITRKITAHEAARLIMAHTGCHKCCIAQLSYKHRKMMKEKKPFNPSDLKRRYDVDEISDFERSVCPSCKRPRLSDAFLDFQRSELPDKTESRFNKPRPSDAFLDFQRSELPDKTESRFNKPRLSDAFLDFQRSETSDKTESRFNKPRPSDAFLDFQRCETSDKTESRFRKPRPSNAFLDFQRSVPSDETDFDPLKSRRVPSRHQQKMSAKPSGLRRTIPIDFTEDDELMKQITVSSDTPIGPSYFDVSARWDLNNGNLYFTNKYFLLPI